MNVACTIFAILIASLAFDEAVSAPRHQASVAQTCFVKFGDAPKQSCRLVYSIEGPQHRQMSVGAKIANGDFSFAGSIIDGRSFKVTEIYAGVPLKASGLCKLTMTAKGRVTAINCRAKGKFGVARMKSTADNPDNWDLIIRRIVPNDSSTRKP
ncbi:MULTISPECIES: hypothetical protein [unclassified Rhizobium]|uniref:hypothetical protein n=1 Tax=unclassified Rhizobium TaxID=2613769 RepID=UPI000EA91098|nr:MULTISPECIES: hypothetical protein [unclassified Rhizobium]AYG67540.1 hypothetical protein CCGE531_17075 [Rhizobium sp. CCGE531]AYG73934.1 hypothetical protein CCGE532_16580 [Rhizobium sp. CCGE532]